MSRFPQHWWTSQWASGCPWKEDISSQGSTLDLTDTDGWTLFRSFWLRNLQQCPRIYSSFLGGLNGKWLDRLLRMNLVPSWWSHVGRLWRLRRQSPTESLLEGFKVRHRGSTSCFLSASWMRIHCDEPPHVPATTCVPTVMNHTHNDTPK